MKSLFIFASALLAASCQTLTAPGPYLQVSVHVQAIESSQPLRAAIQVSGAAAADNFSAQTSDVGDAVFYATPTHTLTLTVTRPGCLTAIARIQPVTPIAVTINLSCT